MTIQIFSAGGGGSGDMTKAVYDPNDDGVIALAQLDTGVMSEAEHAADAHTMIIDGRDVSVDGNKLDGIEVLADVTDATNVAAAGAIMGTLLTTRGDIIFRNATVPARLAKGAANTVLVMGADDPAWSATLAGLTLTSPAINGTIATTGLTMPAFTLGGTLTINGQTFDLGAGNIAFTSTGANTGFFAQTTHAGGWGARTSLAHYSPSPAVDDRVGTFNFYGYDSNQNGTSWGSILGRIADPTDESEDGYFEWQLVSAAANNTAMLLTGAGVLSVDASGGGAAAQVDEFDKVELVYKMDDVSLLNKVVNEKELDSLVDLNIMGYKTTGSGYMLNVQNGIYFSWGMARANRALVQDVIDVIAEEIPGFDKKLEERVMARIERRAMLKGV